MCAMTNGERVSSGMLLSAPTAADRIARRSPWTAAPSEGLSTLLEADARNSPLSSVSWARAATLRERRGAGLRPHLRLPRRPVGVRAAHLHAGDRRRGQRARGVHARLLPPRAEPLRRGDDDEAV